MRTLSSEDAFFLYLETPDQHQHVVATMILDPSTAPGPITIDTLIKKFETELWALPEFDRTGKMRPVSTWNLYQVSL